MHYDVITKRTQSQGRWITFWLVEVIEGDRKVVYHFSGRRCLERYLTKLKLKIAEQNNAQQAKAKATAATLRKRHTTPGGERGLTARLVKSKSHTKYKTLLAPQVRESLRRKQTGLGIHKTSRPRKLVDWTATSQRLFTRA